MTAKNVNALRSRFGDAFSEVRNKLLGKPASAENPER
jgi:hypothetical protein